MQHIWKIIIVVLVVVALAGVIWFMAVEGSMENLAPVENTDLEQGEDATSSSETDKNATVADVEVVVDELEIPWDIAFLPDGGMLVTERPGRLLHLDENLNRTEVVSGLGVHVGEGGLLGVVLHPNFQENRFVYLYFTSESLTGRENRIERYHFDGVSLADKVVILDGIKGAPYHDGGRLAFGPDGYLYIAVGDATDEEAAQNPQSLPGSILRINDDGSIPQDNPFGNAVWSYGHRNPQGLTWDDEGRLWSTEHGRSGALSGLDEINIVEPGINYGWPIIEGNETENDMRAPILHSGADVTWAPASALYYRGSLFFGGLRGEALYEAKLDGQNVQSLQAHFKGEFGRIRSVRLGPDGYFYLTTSNRDGRGDVRLGDDKIIRINPEAL